MAEEDTEFLKLPVEDRCVHKSWKARQSGFDEAKKLFNQWDGDDPNWKKFGPIIKKFVSESNAIVLESGLEATLAFVENCDNASRYTSEIMDGLIAKCVGSPKAKTRELARQICLMLCEIEVHEKVIEDLIKGLSQKNPKVVSGCLNIMTECLRCFGAKVIKVSPLLKATVPLLDHRDKTVREEGKCLIIESYRWIGDIMKQQLTGLKPVQLTELETEFEKVTESGGKAKPERYLRSQMPTHTEGGAGATEEGQEDEGDGDEGDAEDEEVDPFELLDPVEILPKLPKNFYELVEEKKWQLRKEALDALLPLAQSPKIASGDYNELVRVLKKFIAKDTNVILVAQAAQCLAGLAKGLRAAGFKNHAGQCLPVVLEKFKEKKTNVVTALTEASDALYPCLGIEAIQEDCLASLKHKTPAVNTETAKFLARCFAKCPPALATNKKLLKAYVSGLSDRLTHSDVTVRDAASEALGVLMKFLGEATLTKLMPDIDNIKMAKIKEFEEKAVLTGKPASAAPPPAAKKTGGAKVVKPNQQANASKSVKPAAAVKKPAGKPVVKPATKSAPPPKPTEVDDASDDNLDENEAAQDNLPRVDISPKLTDAFLAKLGDKNWKMRKEAVDELKDIINTAKFIEGNINNLTPILATRFSDSNKIISVQAIEIAKDLAVALGPKVKPHLPELLPALLGCLSESKPNVRASVVAALETILEQTLLKDFFADEMMYSVLSKGNPFTKQEIFKLLTEYLPKAKGIPKDDLSVMLPILYLAIEDRNAEVRKSAQEAVPAFMRHLGYQKMVNALDKCKPGTKSAVTPLLDKARETVPQPEPKKPAAKSATGIRGGATRAAPSSAPEKKAPGKLNLVSRPGTAKTGPSSKKKGEEIDLSPPYVASNLKNTRFREESKLKVLKWNFGTPRQEFVDQLREQMTAANFNKTLVNQMFHNDFKQHLKAIEMLSSEVSSDTEALVSNLDLILKWSTFRFFETNPSVLLKTLDYLLDVFTILGDDSYNLHDIEAQSFIPYIINKVGDPKDQVRASVKKILKALCKVYPASKLSPFLMTGLSSKNAKQRAECLDELGYLVSGYGSSVLQPTVTACLKEVGKQIADRDNGVRNAALNCIAEVYFQDGEKMYKALGNIPEKDMAMLEERIKRQSKTRTVVNSASKNESTPQAKKVVRGIPPPQITSSGKPSQMPRPTSVSAIARPLAGRSAAAAAASAAAAAAVAAEGLPPPSIASRQFSSTPDKPKPVTKTGGPIKLDLDYIESLVEERIGRNQESSVEKESKEEQKTFRFKQQSPQSNDMSPSRDLADSPEAYEELDVVLAQVYSQDFETCIQACAELEELMRDTQKVCLLNKRMDQLFVACYMQYRHVLNNMIKMGEYDPQEALRLFQYVTMVLMSAYKFQEMTTKASMSSLHDLLHVILCTLLEPEIAKLNDGPQLIKALNVLSVKIIERSDHTNVTTALLKLLKESIGNRSLTPKYTELVMKCLWKIIKFLPEWNNSLNVDIIIAELHEFLKTFPSAFWKKQDSDTPMRTVKTILHYLVQHRGEEIMNHMTRVTDPESSELVDYLKKLLNSGVGKENSNTAVNQANNENSASKKRSPRFTKSDHETLADIFKKIGQKELSKQGLQELYNFKQQNPHADLEPFLAKSSQYFRDYIERGLKNIENEQKTSSSKSKSSVYIGDNAHENGQNSNGTESPSENKKEVYSYYMDRLKMLRQKGGLDREEQQKQETYRIAASSSQSQQSTTTKTEVQETITAATDTDVDVVAKNVEDIRKRLERIKQGAF